MNKCGLCDNEGKCCDCFHDFFCPEHLQNHYDALDDYGIKSHNTVSRKCE